MTETRLHDAIIECIRKVSPSAWNVFTEAGGAIHKPGRLNILLLVYTADENRAQIERYIKERKEPVHGRVSPTTVTGPIGGYLVALEIYESEELYQTTIHELGHIAASRYQAFQRRHETRKRLSHIDRASGECFIVGNGIPEGETMHGPTFQKAHRRMKARARKVYGKSFSAMRWGYEPWTNKP